MKQIFKIWNQYAHCSGRTMETGNHFKNGASKAILLLVVTMMMACSRGSTPIPEPEPEPEPEPTPVTVTISPLSHEFAATGTTTALTAYSTVTFSRSTLFTARSSQEWCKAEVTTKNLKITVTVNESLEERTAVVSLIVSDVARPEVITVTQAGAALVVATEERGVYLNGNSQEFNLHLSANVPCTVTFPNWVQRVGSSGEMSSGEYSFTAEALVGDERRDSIIFHPTGRFSENTYAIPIVQMQPNIATLNVMTYNLRLESSGDGVNSWYNRRASAVKIICLEDIDILGTQETEENQHNYLKNHIPAFEAFSIGDNGQVKGGPNTIFYRKDRFTAYNKGIFWLSETPDVPSKGWDALYLRIALWIELEDKISGIRFLYVNTHVATWGKTIAQQNSIILLMNKIHELRGNMPVILTGDLNMPPSNDYIKYITDVVNNPYPLVHTKTVADRATGFEGSFHDYHDTDPGPDGLIDYVIVDENAKVLLHQVIPPKLDGIFLSDHSPVTAKIILK